MNIVDRLQARGDRLTAADRRLAEVIVASPQTVGFGTVADLAEAAGVGTATVSRFAVKLGFDGYGDLQDSVQRDLMGQLRPAAERIREQSDRDAPADRRHRHLDIAVANVRATIDSLSDDAVDSVVTRLADDRHDVLVLSGSGSSGVARQFAVDVGQLRPGVSILDGNEIDVQRTLAMASTSPTVLVIDLRRYDRWVLDAVHLAAQRRAWIVALTDNVLSPVAKNAEHCFTLEAGSASPFDSHVGTLALLDLFVSEVARRRRDAATSRLDRLESTWRSTGALLDP